MSKRDYIPLKTQLAAALIQVGCIPHDEAKLLTADQIISLFHRDHYPIRKCDGGSDHPSNLTWRLILSHRTKTAKVDQPEIAKGRRLTAAQVAHNRAMLLKGTVDAINRNPSRWPSGRKIASRPFSKEKRA